MLKLPHRHQKWNNCFYYIVPETGERVPSNGDVPRAQLMDMLKTHYKANKYAVPGNLDEVIDDFCCKVTNGTRCRGDTRPPLKKSSRLTLHNILKGTQILMSWKLLDDGKLVSDTVATSRAEVCIGCAENVQFTGCKSCSGRGLRELIDRIVGGNRLPFDAKLNGCGICNCSLSAKVRLMAKTLHRNLTPEALSKFPSHCWMHEKENG